MYKYFVIMTALLSLTACGGGGSSASVDSGDSSTDPVDTDSGSTPDTADYPGVWTGSVNETAKGLAITDSGGETWFLLMDNSYTPQTLAVFATATAVDGSAAAGTLYPLTDGIGIAASLTGTQRSQEQLSATINAGGETLNYTADFAYNGHYAGAADVSNATGSWVANYGDEGNLIITVSATGTFTAVRENNPSCTFEGSLDAATEPAVYQVIFDESPCGGVLLEGVGLIAPIGEQERIYFLLTTPDQGSAAVFMGTRN